MLLSALFVISTAYGKDVIITGKITDPQNNAIEAATIIFSQSTSTFSATSTADGTYRLTIPGIFPADPKPIITGDPFPAPFSEQVNIPLVTGFDGDIEFAIYSLNGRKIISNSFGSIPAGGYTITWGGLNSSGHPEPRGIYIYAITFRGKTLSGRVIRATETAGTGGATISPYQFPVGDTPGQYYGSAIAFEVTVAAAGHHDVRIAEIAVVNDTIINFTLNPIISVPFKTTGSHIAVYKGGEYLSMILKGINLGVAPPGYFPGEVAYAISPEMYESWIAMMAEAGFNSLRVYTLHPPVFYEKLAEYNQKNQSDPLYLFQGIWLDEPEDPADPAENNLTNRSEEFISSIREVIDCIHGNKSIAFRPGRAYGDYETDISPWVAGFIIGREISPFEVQTTDNEMTEPADWTGNFLTITNATASELFAAKMLDETISYENNSYSVRRTVSMSSWPTLDPLTHPTEIHTDEDVAHIDIMKITQTSQEKLLFASYHAYPYYPDFISDEPYYQTFSDEYGPNNYLGYLTDLKNYYDGIPLIIGEFGVPSSWGDAHKSFSGMNHGGLSEDQQGNYNVRLLRNIINSGCGGGFMFSWMDEWFKQTWIVLYMEAFGISSEGNIIPTRQLWHNLISPEQNFGLITFDPKDEPAWQNYTLSSSENISSVRASHDNAYFYIEFTTNHPYDPEETINIAFDTYLADTGEGLFPTGQQIPNRAEFLLEAKRGADTVSLFVTEAYDMFGLTPRFNLADHSVQKFRSTVTDGAPWKLMRWINNGFDGTIFDLGRLPAEATGSFSFGERTAVTWTGDNKLTIRLPWTLLHFRDPTQGRVIDGAESFDGGRSFEIYSRYTDGIALSILQRGNVTSTLNRYTWPVWLQVPQTTGRPKKSLEIVTEGLRYIPSFVN
ncbi:MAG: hypothetical protein R6W67_12690 [Bacteroidales bacterium]